MVSNIEVLLNNDVLSVIGPPTTITVVSDIGAQGTRGSQIYIGNGLPSATTIPNYGYLVTGDTYINNNNGDLYQYIAHPTGNQWDLVGSVAVPSGISTSVYVNSSVQGTFAIPTYPSQKLTLIGNTQFTFPTTPTSGWRMMLYILGSYTVTFNSVKWENNGSIPTYTSPSLYEFYTFDSGATWIGKQMVKGLA